MIQSRRMSLVEAVTGTAIGLGVSVAANLTVLPMFGYPVTFAHSVWMAVVFTFISVVRSYCVRRLFEAWR